MEMIIPGYKLCGLSHSPASGQTVIRLTDWQNVDDEVNSNFRFSTRKLVSLLQCCFELGVISPVRSIPFGMDVSII